MLYSVEKNLKHLADFLTRTLNHKELNKFFSDLKEIKSIIEAENTEKTKDIFYLFIDKVYSLTPRKNVNNALISLLSKLSLKDITPDKIYKQDKDPAEFKLESSIYFSQLEQHQRKNMKLIEPITNDIGNKNIDDNIRDVIPFYKFLLTISIRHFY